VTVRPLSARIGSGRKNVIQTVETHVDALQAWTLELYKKMLSAFVC
jgi:hypothetical protein